MYKLRNRIRKPRNRTGAGKSRWGATAVEFAMVTPTFLFVIFCCVEFSRISMMRNLTQNAAYEAARYVITEGSTSQDAIDKANEVLDRLGTEGAKVCVNDGAEIEFDTTQVTVRIEVPMSENSFVLPQLYNDKRIISEVTLNTERYRGFFDGGISEETAN